MDLTLSLDATAGLAANRESLFDAPKLALLYAGAALALRADQAAQTTFLERLSAHLAQQGHQDAALGAARWKGLEEAGGDATPFWRGLGKRLGDRNERFSSYKVWFCAALHAGAKPGLAVQFLARVREEWHKSWLDCVPVSHAVLACGALPALDPRKLARPDRERVLALASLAVHADAQLHAREVAVFKACVALLGFAAGDLGFLRGYAEQTAESLAKGLGAEGCAAGMPFVLRCLTGDGLPRPSELAVVRAALAASEVPPLVREAIRLVAGLETGHLVPEDFE